MKNKQGKLIYLFLVPVFGFLGVFYFYPLMSIFSKSFLTDGALDFQRLHRLVTTSIYIKTLWFTFWQAAISTILTLIAALPGAYLFAHYKFRGKKILQGFTTIPFVMPTVVTASAFQALLGKNGVLNGFFEGNLGLSIPLLQADHSIWFILAAHVFYNYTVVLRIVGGFWSRIDVQISEAAKMLGASRRHVFFKITLPLLMPSVMAAAMLVFIFCFSSFGVILILGGPGYSTIETEIYRQAVEIFNLPMAAALSLIQILFTFGFMWVYAKIQRKTSLTLSQKSHGRIERSVKTIKERVFLFINTLSILVLLGAPLAGLIIRSFKTDSGFSFLYYRELFRNKAQSVFFVPPIEAVTTSLLIGGVTICIAVLLGFFSGTFVSKSKGFLSRFLDPLFMLPLSTSAVTLGFGFIIALDKPPLNLRTSPALLPIAHALVAFPFVMRSMLPALRSIPENLRGAAAVMGASSVQVWRHVDLPIIWRAIVVSMIFAFTVSIGEFGASVFIARPQTPTMPLAIYRFLGQPGTINYGQAMAMSSILMVVTAVGIMVLEKFRIDGRGEI